MVYLILFFIEINFILPPPPAKPSSRLLQLVQTVRYHVSHRDHSALVRALAALRRYCEPKVGGELFRFRFFFVVFASFLFFLLSSFLSLLSSLFSLLSFSVSLATSLSFSIALCLYSSFLILVRL